MAARLSLETMKLDATRTTTGRPLRAEAVSVVTNTRMSPAERERVKLAAKANHQTVSQFTRDVLLDAAEECLEILPTETRSRA